jgi:hypothetical protein
MFEFQVLSIQMITKHPIVWTGTTKQFLRGKQMGFVSSAFATNISLRLNSNV